MTRHYIALEIGSSAIKLALARVETSATGDMPHITICAIKRLPLTEQVRYGRIFNLNAAAQVIGDGINDIIKDAPGEIRVHGVYIGVGGRSLGTVSTSAALSLPGYDEIDEKILERLSEEACRDVPESKEILSMIPLKFEVDGQATTNPLGSTGEHISAAYTIVYCDPRNLNNIETVIKDRLELDICGWQIRPLALAKMVLSENDLKAGCMIADIGDQTTTVAVFKDSALRYIATLPLGSRLITQDIAQTMNITFSQAEKLKISRGTAISQSIAATTEQIHLDNIVQARANEIVANISAYIEFAGFTVAELPAGIILTGGGSRLKNIGALLNKTARIPVRMATPLCPPRMAVSAGDDGDILDLLALAVSVGNIAAKPDARPSVSGLDSHESVKNSDTYPDPEHEHQKTRKAKDDSQQATSSEEKVEFGGLKYGGEYSWEDNEDVDKWNSSRTLGKEVVINEHSSEKDDSNLDLGFEIDDEDDPYSLEDDDIAEKKRLRDQERQARQRDKIKRAEADRVEREQKKREAREKKTKLGSRLNTIKNGIFDIFNNQGDDGAELDDTIDS